MKSTRIVSTALSLGLAFAHHGEAQFNLNSEIQLIGTVSAIEFENPHVHITLAAGMSHGRIDAWEIETSSPSMLIRQGWKRTSLKPGDRLTISGHPTRDGSKILLLETAILPNGQRFDPRTFLRN